jgi:phenylalanyl-tRNA synthetase beta chain
MRLSLAWLREWVDWGGDEKALLERLPLRGFEVESSTPFAVGFRGVRLARIRSRSRLDGREGAVFELDLGGEERPRVVSTDPRLAPGDAIAYAPPGATTAANETVAPRTIAGVVSEGMLCSWAELGLGRERDRVLVVPAPEAPPGTDFAALLGVGETIVEIAVTPNRGDCMSVYGLAREIAAFSRRPLLKRPPPPVGGPWIEDLSVDDTEACSWFGLCPISDLSPRRLSLRRRLRLEQAGVSSQHPLVDLTNYILLELGQPLHAFDASALGEGVHVRWGREGESLELLGGERLALGPSHLVVADEAGPRSLAGVLGGKASALGEETRRAWVEAAHFAPRALGRRPERLRIVTDAAQRFERGVDPTLPPVALARLQELLAEEGVGTIEGALRRARPGACPRRLITLPVGEVGRRLGVAEETLDVADHLRSLGLEVRKKGRGTAAAYEVVVPPHRFDLDEPVDLVEEVARLHGFENIPAETPVGTFAPHAVRDLTSRDRLEATIRRFLNARGYDECRHLALVDPEALERLGSTPPVTLVNPLSRETAALATTLWERLLDTAGENLRRQHAAVRLFEIGTVFVPDAKGVEERRVLAVLGAGAAFPDRWCHDRREFDFYDLKGDLDDLLHALGYGESDASPIRFSWRSVPAGTDAGREGERLGVPSTEDGARGLETGEGALNPFAGADLYVDGQRCGVLGHLRPELAEAYGIDRDVFICSIKINAIENKHHVYYKDPLRYPLVVRDLAFTLPDGCPVGDVVAAFRAQERTFLRAIEVFDVYTGPELPEGRRSVGLRLTFADDRGTLSEATVSQTLENLVEVVGRFGGQIRE